MRSGLWVLAWLLLIPASVAADEGAARDAPAKQPAAKASSMTPEDIADRVAQAVAAEDASALRVLGEADEPDPWLVAEELCWRGAFDAAAAFAQVAGRQGHRDGLLPYVEARRGRTSPPAVREALVAQQAALREGNGAAALAATNGLAPDLETLSGIRLLYRQAYALQLLGRLEESAKQFLRAGEVAERIGWLAGATAAFQGSAVSASRGSNFPAARAAWQRRLVLEEARGDRSGMAESLAGLGEVHRSRGDYAAALRFLDRCLALREEVGDPAGVAAALGKIGNVHRDTGDYAKALAFQQKALPMFERLGDRAGVAATFINMGGIYYVTGNPEPALQFYERGLAEAEAVGHEQWATNARANLGNVHSDLGHHDKALQLYEAALKGMRKLGNRAAAASLLGNMGNLQYSRRNYLQALELMERSLAASQALGDRPGVALTLSNLGNVHHALGEYPRARARFDESLRRHQQLGDRAGAATALAGLGNVCFSLGDYAGALGYSERALEVETALGNRAGVAWLLGNLGVVHDSLGDSPTALRYFERAIGLSRELGDRAAVAAQLSRIGLAHARNGDVEAALGAQQKARALFEELEDRSGVANTLGYIGSIHLLRRDFPAALDCHERALALRETIGDRAGAARSLENLALVREGLGEFERAREGHERALAAGQELGASEVILYALSGLAQVYRVLGDPTAAVTAARRGVAALEAFATDLGDLQEAGGRERFRDLFARGLRAGVARGSAEDVGFFLESGRAGRLRMALAARETVRNATSPEVLRREEAAARLDVKRAGHALRIAAAQGALAALREARRAYDTAQEQLREVVARIQRESKRSASIAYPTVDALATIQARLAPLETLVLYGFTDVDGIALVVRREGARVVSLGERSTLLGAARAFHAPDPDEPIERRIAELRRMLIEPLKLEGRSSRVLISPAGPLGYLPFALLMPEREVANIPSGTTHGVLMEDRTRRGTKILALGDPDYRARADRGDPSEKRGSTRIRLPALPATRAEVAAIGDTLLLGADATESKLIAALGKEARWRAVHLACHGLVDPVRPQLSSLAITVDARSDGFLTCLDVFRMRIPADLVVLSACETARGQSYETEGIVGLMRAFMFAGSPRVICSLWKVDDEATQALMTRFYELWSPGGASKGLGTAAALKQAQAFVRSHDKWKHPYYWAAWVLWGLAD